MLDWKQKWLNVPSMSKREEFDFLRLKTMDSEHWRRFLINEIFDMQEKQDVTNGRIRKLEAFRIFSMGVVARFTVTCNPTCFLITPLLIISNIGLSTRIVYHSTSGSDIARIFSLMLSSDMRGPLPSLSSDSSLASLVALSIFIGDGFCT